MSPVTLPCAWTSNRVGVQWLHICNLEYLLWSNLGKKTPFIFIFVATSAAAKAEQTDKKSHLYADFLRHRINFDERRASISIFVSKNHTCVWYMTHVSKICNFYPQFFDRLGSLALVRNICPKHSTELFLLITVPIEDCSCHSQLLKFNSIGPGRY